MKVDHGGNCDGLVVGLEDAFECVFVEGEEA
jgi:hypothetical protein